MKIPPKVRNAYQYSSGRWNPESEVGQLYSALAWAVGGWLEAEFWHRHNFNRHDCANGSQDRYCIDQGHSRTPDDWTAEAKRRLSEKEEEDNG